MPPKKKRKSECQNVSQDGEAQGIAKRSWKKSKARLTLLDDLENGVLSLDGKEVPAKVAWLTYKELPAFQLVPYDQFRDRLRDHRAQVRTRKEQSTVEEQAFRRDRNLHPQANTNSRGELVFDLSPAKELLRADIKAGIHDRMTPEEFQGSREEYQSFSKRKFKERIYQEIRRNKFISYLEMKRAKERETTW